MSKQPILVPVILCGGSGTRLWPLSRQNEPKQFLSLTGSGRTLLQDTALRLAGLARHTPRLAVASSPVVVTNDDTRFLVAGQLAAVGVGTDAIVLEPVGRNTAPALTLAALQALSSHPEDDPLILAMPADHVIADTSAFLEAVAGSVDAALAGAVVTFGVVPDRAETGYGYIECEAPQTRESGSVGAKERARVIRGIRAFVEKPDIATAAAYVRDGRHLWNAGLFMLRCSVWLRALREFRPDILAACEQSMQQVQRDRDFVRPHAEAFASCPPDSIDYAVMERLPGAPTLGIVAQVMPLDAGWSDIGAWDALHAVLPKDSAGNAAVGRTLLHETHNSLVFSSHRLVAAAGVSDVAIVETADALLVMDLKQTQQLKAVVERLKTDNHAIAFTHRKVPRPWGWYDSLDSGERFQVKRIQVAPGASLSLQLHHYRAEHWIVVRGTAEVINGEQALTLQANESVYIPVGQKHRLSNPGSEPLEIIEVQTGTYLGEDDIVRFEDSFGRV